MAWKPKTIFGKIVKGASIGLAGAGAIAITGGAAAGLIGGTGLLSGVVKGVGTLLKGGKKVISKVAASGTKLLTGQTVEENKQLKEIKKQTKEAADKLQFVEKLKSATNAKEIAESKLNFTASEIEEIESGTGNKVTQMAGFTPNKSMLYVALGLAALFVLPKLLKR